MEDQDGAELCFPQFPNTSCIKTNFIQYKKALLYVLFALIISVFSVFLNLLVIISVSHFRQLHTPTNLLILSLAVSDFFYGFMAIIDVYNLTACWFLGDLMCLLYFYINAIVLSASIGNMILISVDRYVAICDPLHYSTRVTVTRVQMSVCVSWICCAVYTGLISIDFFTHPDRYRPCYGRCVGGTDSLSLVVDNVLSSLAPVTVIIILYMRVFVVAVSQACAMRSHVTAVTLQPSGTVMTKKSELKAARTLGIVVFVFLMCYCPYFCSTFVPGESGGMFQTVGTFLLQLSPCLNPVIYALFYPWFRKSIRFILSLQILQPGSRETNML